jgi:Kdo2-lipid A phosphotransferase
MSWNYKKLLLCHGIIALLILSYFLPLTKGLWAAIDDGFFHLLNGSLKDHPTWQLFWALCNHKLGDWLHDIVFLGFIIAAIFYERKEARIEKLGGFLFCILYGACVIYFVNRVLFRYYIQIDRLSPSLCFHDTIRLSREITWIGVKDSSKQSFPSDHGTTAIFFAVIYAFLANRKIAFLGCLYGAFMCLPRLITGAHWLSDVIIGSGSIVLFFFSWAFYSPLSKKSTSLFVRFLQLRKHNTA